MLSGYRRESSVDVVLSLCYFLDEDTFPEPRSIFNQEMLFFAKSKSQSLLTRPTKFSAGKPTHRGIVKLRWPPHIRLLGPSKENTKI